MVSSRRPFPGHAALRGNEVLASHIHRQRDCILGELPLANFFVVRAARVGRRLSRLHCRRLNPTRPVAGRFTLSDSARRRTIPRGLSRGRRPECSYRNTHSSRRREDSPIRRTLGYRAMVGERCPRHHQLYSLRFAAYRPARRSLATLEKQSSPAPTAAALFDIRNSRTDDAVWIRRAGHLALIRLCAREPLPATLLALCPSHLGCRSPRSSRRRRDHVRHQCWNDVCRLGHAGTPRVAPQVAARHVGLGTHRSLPGCGGHGAKTCGAGRSRVGKTISAAV